MEGHDVSDPNNGSAVVPAVQAEDDKSDERDDFAIFKDVEGAPMAIELIVDFLPPSKTNVPSPSPVTNEAPQGGENV